MRQTRFDRIEQMFRALMLSVPLLAGVGCLSQHEGPGASDTATNWLKSCTSDSACGGGRCVDKVCKTSCSPSSPSACEWLNESASCETDGTARPACDLTCTASSSCEAFRVGYTCQSGRCRVATLPPLPPIDAGSPTPPTGADSGTTPQTGTDSGTTPPPGADGGTSDAGSNPPSNSGVPTLVSILAGDPSGFIATPHTIYGLMASNGQPLSPPLQVTTSPNDGTFAIPPLPSIPALPLTLHAVGQGSATNPSGTFDALKLDYDASKDALLRIQTVGTATIVQTTGGYTAKSDRAELMVSVFYSDATGKRVGTVGCAKAFLDGDANAAAEADLRYVAASRLPTTLAQLPWTLRSKGALWFGNISKGAHTLRVSIDDGASFLAEVPFYVPITRAEALGEVKAVHIELDVDVPGPNPTPASCPQ